MSEKFSPYEEYLQELYKSKNADDVLMNLEELSSWRESNKLTEAQRFEAQFETVRVLKKLLNSEDSLNEIQDIIINLLLPACLTEDKALQHLVSRYREILSEWLDDLKEIDRISIRQIIFENLLPYLETSDPQSACWVISRIGYRDLEVQDALWKLGRANNNEIGDIALSTISSLSVPSEEIPVLSDELHLRAKNRYNRHLLWAIARIGDISSLPIIFNYWLSPSNRIDYQVDASLAFTAIREIADKNDIHHLFQDKLWDECTKLVEEDPKALYWDFDIGHLPVDCNSPSVVPTLLRWHGLHQDWFDNPNWARYLAQDRLEKCIKPRQLEGWANVGTDVIYTHLKQDACGDTNFDGFTSTQESLAKESAWETLLRAGYEEALNWYEPAVLKETGRFVRQKIMNLFACFFIDPLPESIVQLIVARYDDPGGSDGREISYRMAAVRMARSTATRSAFEALINFGFTYKEQVITSSTDAVAEVAMHLVRQGDTTIVSQLADVVATHKNHAQRLAAANALEVISGEYPTLIEQYLDRFIPLLYEDNREPIEKGVLINTLAHLKEWNIPRNLLSDFLTWSYEPDKWIGGGCLTLLANQGYLEQYPELLNAVLNLRLDDNRWYVQDKKIPFEWAPYIIGTLYDKNPQSFLPVITAILNQSEWQPTVQLIRWLRYTHGKEDHVELPNEIVDTLLQRIIKRQTSIYSETEIFDLLADLAPDRLAEFRWVDFIEGWMPEARVALANALGKSEVHNSSLNNCLTSLELFTGDSMYAVRRAAYRGLAKQSSEYLYALCQYWSESSIIELNRRAAEACGWLENIPIDNGQDTYSQLFNKLKTHPESIVREAAMRSWDERRKRIWAKGYLNRILGVKGKDNYEVLNNWCYADALKLIGDDECIMSLRAYLKKTIAPPNVRYWIQRILETMEKNWKEVTRKWPDPWTDMIGVIENGTGKLISGFGETIEIQYSVWKLPATQPGEKHSWGGTIRSSFEHVLGLKETTIELSRGRKAKIFMRGYSGGIASFIGAGPYPQEGEGDVNGDQ